MKLSKREATMLIALLFIALVFIEYKLVYIPGMDRYNTLVEEDQKYQEQTDEINRMIGSLPALKQKKEKTLSDISAISKPFFNQLNTDALLWNTHQVLLTNQMQLMSYVTTEKDVVSFTDDTIKFTETAYQLKKLANDYQLASTTDNNASIPKPTPTAAPKAGQAGTQTTAKTPENQLEVFSITISQTGTYEQLRKFIADLEALNKTILIKSLKIKSSPLVGVITADIAINYYGVQKIVNDDDQANKWSAPAYISGTGNPFAQNSTTTAPTTNAPVPVTNSTR